MQLGLDGILFSNEFSPCLGDYVVFARQGVHRLAQNRFRLHHLPYVAAISASVFGLNR